MKASVWCLFTAGLGVWCAASHLAAQSIPWQSGAPAGAVAAPQRVVDAEYPGLDPVYHAVYQADPLAAQDQVQLVGHRHYGCGAACGGCGHCEGCRRAGHGCGYVGCGPEGCGHHGRACCDGCGRAHEDCCCRPSHGWRVRLEALYWQRDRGAFVSYSTAGINGPSVLDRDVMELDYELGTRASVEFCTHHGQSVEVLYFGAQHWQDTVDLYRPNTLYSPYAFVANPALNVPGYDAALRHTLGFSSELHNAEVNYWIPLHFMRRLHVAFVLGTRWMHLDEEFLFEGFTTTDASSTFTVARNDLIGGHLGFMAMLPVNCCMSLRFDGRVGGFTNLARQRTHIRTFDIATATQTLDYEEFIRSDHGAFVGQGSLVANYHLSCHITLYAGYEVMWVDGLVLAPEQFNPQFPPQREVRINNNGDVLYHGALAGVEVTW